MPSIRNAAKAIIIRDGYLLTTRNRFRNVDWYQLPGGGQHHGETLVEALRRECMEEIGARVRVGELRFVRDYIGKNHEFADEDSHMHQVEFMFRCSVTDDYVPTIGTEADVYQIGVKWLLLSELPNLRLYPLMLRERLALDDESAGALYLGDIN